MQRAVIQAAAVPPVEREPTDEERSETRVEGEVQHPVSPALSARLKILPRNVTVDAFGQARKRVFARCPAAMTPDNLKRPEIFSEIQADKRTSLQKFDEVFLVAYAEDWFAEAIVADGRASGGSAPASAASRKLKIDRNTGSPRAASALGADTPPPRLVDFVEVFHIY
jgi:hypothetical protein